MGLLQRLLAAFFHSWLGCQFIRAMIAATQYRVFAPWTVRQMQLDLLRLEARRRAPRKGLIPAETRLHVGCGQKRIPGWLNVDVVGTEPVIDLGSGSLPWADRVFDCIASQHVIEHLELHGELIPLLRELHRVAKPGAEIWLSCPDLEKVCRAYVEDRAAALLADRLAHASVETGLEGVPSQQFVNTLFNQDGEHRQLFDFELLSWTLDKAGFGQCVRVTPDDFLRRFPEFPPAANDLHSIYVRAIALPVPEATAAPRGKPEAVTGVP